MAGRHKKHREDPNARQEQDRLICYRYAQCRNASSVGKEFGVSRMYVSRAWERLSEEERRALTDTTEEVSEQLNRRIIEAEQIAGDSFVRKIVEARNLAADELLRRFQKDIKMISDKNFATLFRLVANITPSDEDDPGQNDTYRRLRETIRQDIDNTNSNKHEK